jgi:hypothetical protein
MRVSLSLTTLYLPNHFSGTVDSVSLLAVFHLSSLAPPLCKAAKPNMYGSPSPAEHSYLCPPYHLRLTIHSPFLKSCHTCQIPLFFSLQTFFQLGFLSFSKLVLIPNLLRFSRESLGSEIPVTLHNMTFYRTLLCRICPLRIKFLTWALSGLAPLAL